MISLVDSFDAKARQKVGRLMESFGAFVTTVLAWLLALGKVWMLRVSSTGLVQYSEVKYPLDTKPIISLARRLWREGR